MSIDLLSEQPISLTEAAKHLPRRRRGKKPHVSCLYRWSAGGCRGIVLETVQIGGTRCTSREALARFFERLTQISNPAGHQAISSERRDRQRKRAAEKAAQELAKEGC